MANFGDESISDVLWNEDVLGGRGLEPLLAEYKSTTDLARRERLSRFFAHCSPLVTKALGESWSVCLASLQTLDDADRVELLVPASGRSTRPLDYDIPDIDVLIFRLCNASVQPNQAVVSDGLYVSDLIRHMDFTWVETGQGYDFDNISDIDRSAKTATLHVVEPNVKLSDAHKYFLFQAHSGSISFGHFIFDTLTQLIAYDHLCLSHGEKLTPIIANEQPFVFRWPGMAWLFERLVAPIGHVVHVGRGVRLDAAEVFTTNRMMQLGYKGMSISAVEHLRSRLFAAFSQTAGADSPKRVYITRKDAVGNQREVSNIYAVEQILSQHGFQTIRVADLHPQQVFDLLYGAEIIVGMHGSGLMYNIYTCAPAFVIELTYPGYDWDSILAVASACGHCTERIRCLGDQLDVDQFRSALSAAIHWAQELR